MKKLIFVSAFVFSFTTLFASESMLNKFIKNDFDYLVLKWMESQEKMKNKSNDEGVCSNFKGNWVGVCRGENNQEIKNTIVISQDECQSITLPKGKFYIGGQHQENIDGGRITTAFFNNLTKTTYVLWSEDKKNLIFSTIAGVNLNGNGVVKSESKDIRSLEGNILITKLNYIAKMEGLIYKDEIFFISTFNFNRYRRSFRQNFG